VLSYVKLPKVFWGKALLTTNYLQNKNPTKVVTLNRTPYGLRFGRQPIYLTLESLGVKHMFLFTRRKDTNWIHIFMNVSFLGITKSLRLIALCTLMIEKRSYPRM